MNKNKVTNKKFLLTIAVVISSWFICSDNANANPRHGEHYYEPCKIVRKSRLELHKTHYNRRVPNPPQEVRLVIINNNYHEYDEEYENDDNDNKDNEYSFADKVKSKIKDDIIELITDETDSILETFFDSIFP